MSDNYSRNFLFLIYEKLVILLLNNMCRSCTFVNDQGVEREKTNIIFDNRLRVQYNVFGLNPFEFFVFNIPLCN